ncbi:MAG: M56 family metallopeptidase [Clostridia bacterium]|nr:M56 family metallopeptidase [Clostridia bacterium]
MSIHRVFWAIFLPAIVAFAFAREMEYEQTASRLGVILKKKPGRVTVVYQSPLFMVAMLMSMAPVYFAILGFKDGAWELMDLLLEAMILLSIYYAVLLLVLPLLRRIVSARACATLWLLPSFLYWLPHMWRNYPVIPKVVLRMPHRWAEILGVVWLVGFVAVLAWKITGHLLFRREVLTDAYEVTDHAILELWERELRLIERKKPISLLYSPRVASPMTIGKSNRSIRTLLPERAYTAKELELIFRHELRHVQRLDVDTKMYYAFCLALCWFNPLVWIAVKKAAADLELSCDEMVLHGREEAERRRYAELLLDCAGDDRGFTTCLSSSAKTLRYRLKNVMGQRERLDGVLLVGFCLSVLLFCSGMVVVSRSYGTLDEVLFKQLEDTQVTRLYASEYVASYDYAERVYGWDSEGLTAVLREIPVTKVMERSSVKLDLTPGPQMYVLYDRLELDISQEWIKITRSPMSSLKGVYRVDGPIDWDALFACVDFDAPDPDPGPVRPRLAYYISHRENADEPFGAVDCLLARTDDTGQVWPMDEPLTNWDHTGGISGYALPEGATVRFDFTYDPVWYTVEVIGRNGEEAYTVKGEDLPDHVMELATYSANYRIRAFFSSYRNTTYDMEFYFHIDLSEEE